MRPGAGGTCVPFVLNSWPMKPSGVWATRPIRPPERVTRASSAAVRSWSGANIAPNTEVTTSNEPSANGSASASPSMNVASTPSASARWRAWSSSAGT